MITDGWVHSCRPVVPLCSVEYMLDQEGKLDKMTVANECRLDMAPGPSTHLRHVLRMRQEVCNGVAEPGEVRRILEQNAGARYYLVGDPTDVGRDDWAGLPHCLRHGQAEALLEALLHHDRGAALDRIDHEGVDVGILHWQSDEGDRRSEPWGKSVPGG